MILIDGPMDESDAVMSYLSLVPALLPLTLEVLFISNHLKIHIQAVLF